MHNDKIENGSRQIRRVTNIGIVINIALTVVKVIVGVFGNSMALIADGIHSLSDLATDVVVLVGVHFGAKEADPEHPYGHGRIETFSAIAIALVLMTVALGMVYKAGVGIAEVHMRKPGNAALVVAFISIASKEWLYRITRKVGIATQSSAVFGNAWHHRSDALSSIAVVAGLLLTKFGFNYGDHLAAIVVGVMIFHAGWRTIMGPLAELSEGSVDSATIERITEIINANPQIRGWHKLRTRNVGREVFLDLHILVDPSLTISAAHEISERLEDALNRQMTRPVNITVHIEPDLPSLRK